MEKQRDENLVNVRGREDGRSSDRYQAVETLETMEYAMSMFCFFITKGRREGEKGSS